MEWSSPDHLDLSVEKISILATSSIGKSKLAHPSLPWASALSSMSCSSYPTKQRKEKEFLKKKEKER